MSSSIFRVVFSFFFLIFSSLSFADNKKSSRPFILDHSEVVDFHAKSNGKDYEVYIRTPDSYAANPAKKYPLIVLTDGYYAFPLLSSINWRMSERHEEYQQAIIVGISYSKGDGINESRTRDFTPTHAAKQKFNADDAQAFSGGAPQYVEFISREVMPYFLNHYRINNREKIFAGHSYGGLLAAYILFTQPELFDYYLIGSPSLWYDNKVLFQFEADYAKTHKDLAAQVFIATGAEENDPEHAMTQNMFVLEKLLQSRKYPSLKLNVKSLADEGHLTGYPAFITQGLLWAIPIDSSHK